MKKTFNISENYEEYHEYFKSNYQKVLYDLMLCKLLKAQYKAKENDIDINMLVNTIIKFNVDMEAVIALIYQIYDGKISSQVKVQKLPANENTTEIKKEEDGFSDLAINENLSSEGENN
jgi:hypothetical protein